MTTTHLFDADGIPTRPVELGEFRQHWQIGRDLAYHLIHTGQLRAHRKNPSKRGSPWIVSPAAARAYARSVGALDPKDPQ